ncbi:MAG: hypothetical protein ACRCV3_00540 [Desulfovibrionaceae bacterium]
MSRVKKAHKHREESAHAFHESYKKHALRKDVEKNSKKEKTSRSVVSEGDPLLNVSSDTEKGLHLESVYRVEPLIKEIPHTTYVNPLPVLKTPKTEKDVKRPPSKSMFADAHSIMRRDGITTPTHEEYEREELGSIRERGSVSEEKQNIEGYIQAKKKNINKRGLEDLLRPWNKVILSGKRFLAFNEKTGELFRKVHEHLERDSSVALWRNRSFRKDLFKLYLALKSIIPSHSEKNPKTGKQYTFSMEDFSRMDFYLQGYDEKYKEMHHKILDNLPNESSSIDLTRIPGYRAELDLESQRILFVLLNLLRKNDFVSSELLAKFSATIKRKGIANEEMHKRDGMFIPLFCAKSEIEENVQGYRNFDLQPHVYFDHNTLFSNDYYYGDSGMCLLFIAMINYQFIEHPEDAEKRINNIVNKLNAITQLNYEEKMEYLKGLSALNADIQLNSSILRLLTADELGSEELEKANEGSKLLIDQVLEKLMDPNANLGNSLLIDVQQEHAIGVIRFLAVDPETKTPKILLRLSDANVGAVTVTSLEEARIVLKEFLGSGYGEVDIHAMPYQLRNIDPGVYKNSMSRYDTPVIDFFEGNIFPNERLKVPLYLVEDKEYKLRVLDNQQAGFYEMLDGYSLRLLQEIHFSLEQYIHKLGIIFTTISSDTEKELFAALVTADKFVSSLKEEMFSRAEIGFSIEEMNLMKEYVEKMKAALLADYQSRNQEEYNNLGESVKIFEEKSTRLKDFIKDLGDVMLSSGEKMPPPSGPGKTSSVLSEGSTHYRGKRDFLVAYNTFIKTMRWILYENQEIGDAFKQLNKDVTAGLTPKNREDIQNGLIFIVDRINDNIQENSIFYLYKNEATFLAVEDISQLFEHRRTQNKEFAEYYNAGYAVGLGLINRNDDSSLKPSFDLVSFLNLDENYLNSKGHYIVMVLSLLSNSNQHFSHETIGYFAGQVMNAFRYKERLKTDDTIRDLREKGNKVFDDYVRDRNIPGPLVREAFSQVRWFSPDGDLGISRGNGVCYLLSIASITLIKKYGISVGFEKIWAILTSLDRINMLPEMERSGYLRGILSLNYDLQAIVPLDVPIDDFDGLPTSKVIKNRQVQLDFFEVMEYFNQNRGREINVSVITESHSIYIGAYLIAAKNGGVAQEYILIDSEVGIFQCKSVDMLATMLRYAAEDPIYGIGSVRFKISKILESTINDVLLKNTVSKFGGRFSDFIENRILGNYLLQAPYGTIAGNNYDRMLSKLRNGQWIDIEQDEVLEIHLRDTLDILRELLKSKYKKGQERISELVGDISDIISLKSSLPVSVVTERVSQLLERVKKEIKDFYSKNTDKSLEVDDSWMQEALGFLFNEDPEMMEKMEEGEVSYKDIEGAVNKKLDEGEKVLSELTKIESTIEENLGETSQQKTKETLKRVLDTDDSSDSDTVEQDSKRKRVDGIKKTMTQGEEKLKLFQSKAQMLLDMLSHIQTVSAVMTIEDINKYQKSIKDFQQECDKIKQVVGGLELMDRTLLSMDNSKELQNKLSRFESSLQDVFDGQNKDSKLAQCDDAFAVLDDLVRAIDGEGLPALAESKLEEELFRNKMAELKQDVSAVRTTLDAFSEEKVWSYPKALSKEAMKRLTDDDALRLVLESKDTYYAATINADEGARIAVYSEGDLRKNNLLNDAESINLKNQMHDLDIAFENLLRDAGLDPNKYFAPELEVAKVASESQEDLKVLTSETLTIVDVETGSPTILKTAGTVFLEKARKFHTKMLELSKRADIFFKGVTLYSSVQIISNARLVYENLKNFEHMDSMQQLLAVSDTTDMVVDLGANTLGAINKLAKTSAKAISSMSSKTFSTGAKVLEKAGRGQKVLGNLSKGSRVLGRISMGVGVIASGVRLAKASIDYNDDPNNINTVTLVFEGLELFTNLLSTAYPPAAVITVPLSFLLGSIHGAIIEGYLAKEHVTYAQGIVKQLQAEAGKVSSPLLTFVNGMAIMRGSDGGILAIKISGNTITLELTRAVGTGYNTYPTPNSEAEYYAISPRNENSKRSEEESTVFPLRNCIRNAKYLKDYICVKPHILSKYLHGISKKYKACKDIDLYERLVRHRIKHGEAPITLREHRNNPGKVREYFQSKEPLEVVVLPEQYQGYKVVKEGELFVSSTNKNDFAFHEKDKMHEFTQCANINALRVGNIKYSYYPQFVANFLRKYVVYGHKAITVDIVDDENKQNIMFVCPQSAYQERHDLAKELSKREGVSASVLQGVPLYNEYIMRMHSKNIVTLLAHGNNKIKAVSPRDRDGNLVEGGGFNILVGDLFDGKRSLIRGNDKKYRVIDWDSEKSTLILGGMSIDLSGYHSKNPILLRTKENFLYSLNRKTGKLNPILYNADFKGDSSAGIFSLFPPFNGLLKDIRVHLRCSPIKDGLIEVDKIFTLNSVPYYYWPKGKAPEYENLRISKVNNMKYIPNKEHGDRVAFIHIYPVREGLLKEIDPRSYNLIHVDYNLYDYPSFEEGNENNKMVSYFYSEQEGRVIAQVGYQELSSAMVFTVDKAPKRVSFKNGDERVYIEGCVTMYDTQGYPLEMHVIEDGFGKNREKSERKIKETLKRMAQGELQQPGLERKVLLGGIKYQAKSEKEYRIRGHISPKTQMYSFEIPELMGKKVAQISTPSAIINGKAYTYYMAKEEGEDGKVNIFLYAMQIMSDFPPSPLEDVDILEDFLPDVIPLFQNLKIAKVLATDSNVIIKTHDGLLLEASLDGADSKTKIIEISEEFLKEYGYDPENQEDVVVAVQLASLLHGELVNNIVSVRGVGEVEESLVDLRTSVTAPVVVDSFREEYTKKNVRKVVPHIPHQRKPRDVSSRKDVMSEGKRISRYKYDILGYVVYKDSAHINCLYSKDLETLMYESSNVNVFAPAAYQVDKLEIEGSRGRVRVGRHNEPGLQRGLFLPGVSNLIFESSHAKVRGRFVYGALEMDFVDEITLQHFEGEGEVPILDFVIQDRFVFGKVEKSVIAKRHVFGKDLVLYLLRSNTKEREKPSYVKVTLHKFFNYPESSNPYNNKVFVADKPLSTADLMNLYRAPLEPRGLLERELRPERHRKIEL